MRLLSGIKSWYLSLQAVLSDSPDGFLPMECVRTWPSTPSTSTRSECVDLRSMSSAFQLDRRDDPVRRSEDALQTVRCCWDCGCRVSIRTASSRDVMSLCKFRVANCRRRHFYAAAAIPTAKLQVRPRIQQRQFTRARISNVRRLTGVI